MLSIKVFQTSLAKGLPLPQRAHTTDIGWDIQAAVDFSVAPGEAVRVPTGLVFDLPEGPIVIGTMPHRLGLVIEQRTGNGGRGLFPAATIVDPGYRSDKDDPNGLTLLLRNVNRQGWFGRGALSFKRGDKVVQGIFQLFPWVELAGASASDISWDTERGAKRFGATGR